MKQLLNAIKNLFTKKQTHPVNQVVSVDSGADPRIVMIHEETEEYLNKWGYSFKWVSPLDLELFDRHGRYLARVCFKKECHDSQTVVGLLPRSEADKEEYVRKGWLIHKDSISWKFLPLWNICYFASVPEHYVPLYELGAKPRTEA